LVPAVVDSPPGRPDVTRIVAPNPGPMTLEGTNTYVVAAADGAWVIDPGPADAAHVERIRAASEGGIAGVVLTHSHLDHSEAVASLGAPLRFGEVGSGDEAAIEPGAPNPGATILSDQSEAVGPFEVLPTPGHAIDHVCFVLASADAPAVCFCGDLVLGAGSSFVPPDGGSLAAYMDSLEVLLATPADVLCPGHGPYITSPAEKVEEYIAHRRERETRLLAALGRGERSRARLLDEAWADVAPDLRPAAAIVMQAHLEKLAAEGRLPEGGRGLSD
jgi:glyoxylase-like metal-dependent hydrolase (beta-lactamase superfamily II)